MILDQLSQSRRYIQTLPGLDIALGFLERLTPAAADGRYDLDGARVYCLVQRYRTRDAAEAKFEAHRRYADVQCLLAGRETILWAPLPVLGAVTEAYLAERDVEFYQRPAAATALRLEPGRFVVLFPNDGHAPGLECGGPTDVVKAVVKVRVS